TTNTIRAPLIHITRHAEIEIVVVFEKAFRARQYFTIDVLRYEPRRRIEKHIITGSRRYSRIRYTVIAENMLTFRHERRDANRFGIKRRSTRHALNHIFNTVITIHTNIRIG